MALSTEMPLHVDLVQNQWAAGLQIRVACVEAVADHVELSYAQPEYQELLQRADPSGSLEKSQPAEVFATLSRLYNNSYFFVTDPHDDSTCPYRNGVVRMTVRMAEGAP
jgi:hypothetical protein